MEARTVVMIPAAIVVLMIGGSVFALTALPADALVPTHFDLSGKPDAFAHPLVAFSILPAVTIVGLVITALFAHRAEVRSPAAFKMAVLAPFAILAVTHGLAIAYALGIEVNVMRVLVLVIGLVLIMIGNVLGKSGPIAWSAS